MRALRILFGTAWLMVATAAGAVQPDEIMSDPALEARARALSAQLRCMVCQNQSIDDSDAALARDIRLLVRDRLKSGDSDAAIKQFLVARYGNFILLKPPFTIETLLLWLTPLLALALGSIAIWRAGIAKRSIETAPLDAAEAARVDALLAGDE
ncbi:MAG: cytochrome c-type biogenesis protein CcmH [Methylobacteriaceae bacterium]|nr:cytochrome c-type biogenesis protein CcmH [Methylobacteriaceae bacterium]